LRLVHCKCKSLMQQSLHLSSISLSLSRVTSQKLSETGAKFCHLYRKFGSPSKNLTSDFAPEVAKYSQSSPQQQLRKCMSLLLHPISDAACCILCQKVGLMVQHTSRKTSTLNLVHSLIGPIFSNRINIASEFKIFKLKSFQVCGSIK